MALLHPKSVAVPFAGAVLSISLRTAANEPSVMLFNLRQAQKQNVVFQSAVMKLIPQTLILVFGTSSGSRWA